MVANMFLIQSLNLMARISSILGKSTEEASFALEASAAISEFQQEYVTPSGRISSDTQAAYALAICLDLLAPAQMVRAGERLAHLVRRNGFKIGTGFAGTPFVCEALAKAGHAQVAYAMLLEKSCPSWLYPVTMGATTMWERWDSMLPDGTINPGKMTSFNHYAFGAIAKFLYERVAGLQRVDPGWRRFRIAPLVGADLSHASASHETLRGTASCSWNISSPSDGTHIFELQVSVPPGAIAEVVIPEGTGNKYETLGPGDWSFTTNFKRDYEWPIPSMPAKSN
jgi:alpha-L-rhamnosidase